MGDYSGTYTVVNATGNTITNVSVKLTCGDHKNNATSASLAPNGTITANLNSQTGSKDLWTIYFDMDGKTYTRDNKQCNYMEDDKPQDVVVSLYRADFSIVMPVTSSCMNNYYSTPAEMKNEARAAAETTGGVKAD